MGNSIRGLTLDGCSFGRGGRAPSEILNGDRLTFGYRPGERSRYLQASVFLPPNESSHSDRLQVYGGEEGSKSGKMEEALGLDQ